MRFSCNNKIMWLDEVFVEQKAKNKRTIEEIVDPDSQFIESRIDYQKEHYLKTIMLAVTLKAS